MFEELLEIYRSKVAEVEQKQREVQANVVLVTAIEKISSECSSIQNGDELLRRLADQVDLLSKEVNSLKGQAKSSGRLSSPVRRQEGRESKSLDRHARRLIDLIREKPGSYTTSDLVELLDLNKTTVISVMKRAADLDPGHIKLTKGKRRKLHLAYVPDDAEQLQNAE